jgi:hypothetical protein
VVILTGFAVIEPTDNPRCAILEFPDYLLKQFPMFLKDLFWGLCFSVDSLMMHFTTLAINVSLMITKSTVQLILLKV